MSQRIGSESQGLRARIAPRPPGDSQASHRGKQGWRSADDRTRKLAASTRPASTQRRESDTPGCAGETIALIEKRQPREPREGSQNLGAGEAQNVSCRSIFAPPPPAQHAPPCARRGVLTAAARSVRRRVVRLRVFSRAAFHRPPTARCVCVVSGRVRPFRLHGWPFHWPIGTQCNRENAWYAGDSCRTDASLENWRPATPDRGFESRPLRCPALNRLRPAAIALPGRVLVSFRREYTRSLVTGALVAVCAGEVDQSWSCHRSGLG